MLALLAPLPSWLGLHGGWFWLLDLLAHFRWQYLIASAVVLHYLRQSGADVIFLMEIDQRWLAALEPLQANYPHRIADPRGDNFGVALPSRVPWRSAGVVNIGTAGLPSVEIAITHQGRELVLIGTHSVPPVGPRNAALRDGQLAALGPIACGSRASRCCWWET